MLLPKSINFRFSVIGAGGFFAALARGPGAAEVPAQINVSDVRWRHDCRSKTSWNKGFGPKRRDCTQIESRRESHGDATKR